MRILDLNKQKKLNNVILYLTPEEAQEMKDSLEVLIKNKDHHHSHISDENFEKEITVCIYRDDNLSSFDDRSRTLILRDE